MEGRDIHEELSAAAAGRLFQAWHDLWLLAEAPDGSGRQWRQHLERLERVVTADEVRVRLSAGARYLVDTHTRGPRCSRCWMRLVEAQEVRRMLCIECALEFIHDEEAGEA